jgi:hypothetical protein
MIIIIIIIMDNTVHIKYIKHKRSIRKQKTAEYVNLIKNHPIYFKNRNNLISSEKLFSRDICFSIFNFLEFNSKLTFIGLSKTIYINIHVYKRFIPIKKIQFIETLTLFQQNKLNNDHIMKQIMDNQIYFTKYILLLQREICHHQSYNADFDGESFNLPYNFRGSIIYSRYRPYIPSGRLGYNNNFNFSENCKLCKLCKEILKNRIIASKCSSCNKMQLFNSSAFTINNIIKILMGNSKKYFFPDNINAYYADKYVYNNLHNTCGTFIRNETEDEEMSKYDQMFLFHRTGLLCTENKCLENTKITSNKHNQYNNMFNNSLFNDSKYNKQKIQNNNKNMIKNKKFNRSFR